MDLEYEILKAIYDSKGQKILKDDLAKPYADDKRKYRLMCRHLMDTKCIKGDIDGYFFYLQPNGIARYLELEKEREQNAKSEKQQAFENKISVANVVIPVVSFLAGVAVEHLAGIVNVLSSLFH